MVEIYSKEFNDKKIVTLGAYREYYEHLGYEIVTNKKGKPVETKKVENEEKVLENYSRK